MGEFLTNQNWRKNPKVAQGDIAVLKYQDGFVYKVKCIVTVVTGENIEGHVEAVFDSQKNEATSHELNNKKLRFAAERVFEVIKNTG